MSEISQRSEISLDIGLQKLTEQNVL